MRAIEPPDLELPSGVVDAWSMAPLQSWALILLLGVAVWGLIQIIRSLETHDADQTQTSASRPVERRPVSQFYDQDAPENRMPRRPELRALERASAVVIPAVELERRRQARALRAARQTPPPVRRSTVRHPPVSQFYDQDAPENR